MVRPRNIGWGGAKWAISKLMVKIAALVLKVAIYLWLASLKVAIWLWLASVRPADVTDPGYIFLHARKSLRIP
jgi:hypothetical protein